MLTPRPDEEKKPLTTAQRQARHRAKQDATLAKWRAALEQVAKAKTVQEAQEIANNSLKL